MTCPACSKALSTMKMSDLTVEICSSACGGIWFDNLELQKVDEAHESAGEGLLDVGPHTPVKTDPSTTRNCPKCEGQRLLRQHYSVRNEIEVDTCPRCGGVWLDTGELSSIRKEFATEAKRKEAAEKYFDALFGRQLAAEAKKGAEARERARKSVHVLRFIMPSYWLPGKQTWGAF